MTIVKGTKHRPVKVVESRPVLRSFLAIAGLVLVAAAVVASHRFGYVTGIGLSEPLSGDNERLREAIDEKSRLVTSLEQKLANINLGAEVDRQANEEIRQEVIALKQKIAQLEEENSFYRGLMAPTKNKRGLAFGAVELSRTDTPRTFSYKVVLQQLATNHQLLNGTLEYNVVGRSGGLDVTYNLNQLSSQVTLDAIKLRFKYFQTIEGEFSLPEGFDPVTIELVAKSSGKNPVTVEKRFGWLVEEVL